MDQIHSLLSFFVIFIFEVYIYCQFKMIYDSPLFFFLFLLTFKKNKEDKKLLKSTFKFKAYSKELFSF